jgi:hypothetical protein
MGDKARQPAEMVAVPVAQNEPVEPFELNAEQTEIPHQHLGRVAEVEEVLADHSVTQPAPITSTSVGSTAVFPHLVFASDDPDGILHAADGTLHLSACNRPLVADRPADCLLDAAGPQSSRQRGYFHDARRSSTPQQLSVKGR